MSPNYEIGSIVWARLGQKWWPGRVSSLEEFSSPSGDFKRGPIAVVKFFNEQGSHEITKQDHILPYNCSRKNDLIRKGLNSVKHDFSLREKFEADISTSEKLTGGNVEIIKELQEATKRRIDYSDLGFGSPKLKKRLKDESFQRDGFTDIGEAIQYKRGSSPLLSCIIEHETKIMEQPKMRLEDEVQPDVNFFKCYACGFTCGRLNVIIWHNKNHLKKVEDYDSGIRIPGRRKRRKKTTKGRDKNSTNLNPKLNHAQTNGHMSPKENSQETSQLLLDWEDDDQEDETKGDVTIKEELSDAVLNGEMNNEEILSEDDEDDDEEIDFSDDEYDDNYPPPTKGQRHPMPKQVDINSAFDALLAESSPLNQISNSNINSSYVNNDSDSECSDWEKYCGKESDSDNLEEDEECEEEQQLQEESVQNGHCSQSPNTDFANKSNHEPQSEATIDSVDATLEDDSGTGSKEKQASSESSSSLDSTSKAISKKEKCSTPPPSRHSPSKNKSSQHRSKPKEVAGSPSSPGPSISKSSSPLPERSQEEPSEDHSTHSSSSSSSTSSGPAYMLVAVDAHGNNVPMPVLSEGGNHLVAVEASMEDGTTRTLYIDPAHLGPNVDLNNLMLHIDNSGQETVIIPTSTSDGEIISSTLVEQPPHYDSGTDSHPTDAVPEDDDEPQSSKANKELNERERKHQSPELPEKSKESTKASTEPSKAEEEDAKEGHVEEESKKKKKKKRNRESHKDNEEEIGKKKKKDKKEKKEKKREKERIISSSDELDNDELPDFEADVSSYAMFSADEMVWVMIHGLWWPSYVLDVSENGEEATILYINCQQKTPIKISLDRIKRFSSLDYLNTFDSQKDKAAGLTEAMEMAEQFINLKEAKALKETPRKFFSRPLNEQKTIINKRLLALRGVHLDAENSSPTRSYNAKERDPRRTEPELSEDCLSKRECIKLASATKARRSANERFIRYIKSDTCLEYLREICSGKRPCPRHAYFKDNYKNKDYLNEVTGVYNMGIYFFGEDTEQVEDLISFLLAKFEKEQTELALDNFQRNVYINTVLLPEAIKESLRILTKTAEEELEAALETGFSQTKTEKKAKRLDYT